MDPFSLLYALYTVKLGCQTFIWLNSSSELVPPIAGIVAISSVIPSFHITAHITYNKPISSISVIVYLCSSLPLAGLWYKATVRANTVILFALVTATDIITLVAFITVQVLSRTTPKAAENMEALRTAIIEQALEESRKRKAIPFTGKETRIGLKRRPTLKLKTLPPNHSQRELISGYAISQPPRFHLRRKASVPHQAAAFDHQQGRSAWNKLDIHHFPGLYSPKAPEPKSAWSETDDDADNEGYKSDATYISNATYSSDESHMLNPQAYAAPHEASAALGWDFDDDADNEGYKSDTTYISNATYSSDESHMPNPQAYAAPHEASAALGWDFDDDADNEGYKSDTTYISNATYSSDESHMPNPQAYAASREASAALGWDFDGSDDADDEADSKMPQSSSVGASCQSEISPMCPFPRKPFGTGGIEHWGVVMESCGGDYIEEYIVSPLSEG